jgi:hypothetical protein
MDIIFQSKEVYFAPRLDSCILWETGGFFSRTLDGYAETPAGSLIPSWRSN